MNEITQKSGRFSLGQSWFVWGVAALFFCYQFMLRVAPSVMTTELMRDFSVDACSLGTLTSFYFYAYAGLQVPVGTLLDRIGPRRLLAFAVIICCLGTLLFAYSSQVSSALLGRFLIGTGSAFGFLSCMKLGTLWFPPQRLAIVVGLTLFIGTLGAMSGSFPMAALVEEFGWRSAMVVVSFVGFFLAFLIWIIVKDQAPLPLKSYIESHHTPLSYQPSVADAFRIVLEKPQTWILALYGVLMYVPLAGFADMWGVPFLSSVHSLNKSTAALATSALYLGVGIGTPLAALLSNHFRSYRLSLWGAAAGSLIPLLIIFYVPGLSSVMIICLLFLTGIMLSGQFMAYTIVCDINPIVVSGTATGFQNMVCLTSGIIFQPFIGWLLDLFWQGTMENGVRSYHPIHYQTALSSVIVCLIFAFIISFWIKESFPDE